MKREDTIREFILWALEPRVMLDHDAVIILGIHNPKDRHKVGWKTGGIGNRCWLDEA